MIIRSIKTGREIEVMEGTTVPEGFTIKATNHTCETNVSQITEGIEERPVTKMSEKTGKAKKGVKKYGKDE